jgi:hypothetical protein
LAKSTLEPAAQVRGVSRLVPSAITRSSPLVMAAAARVDAGSRARHSRPERYQAWVADAMRASLLPP